jgi:hypothetical protein
MSRAGPLRLRDLLGHINDSLARLRQLGELDQATVLADYCNIEGASKLASVARRARLWLRAPS